MKNSKANHILAKNLNDLEKIFITFNLAISNLDYSEF